METYKLDDTVIAQIAKLVQVAFLTGTDIVDNLRTLELCIIDGNINLTPDYSENFQTNLDNMMEELEEKEIEIPKVGDLNKSPGFFSKN
jgi:hypothetical protein